MSSVLKYFRQKPKYKRILEYEGFDYEPMKITSLFSPVLSPFGVEYWQCENSQCSGRLTKIRGNCTLRIPHDICVVGNEGQEVTDSAGAGAAAAAAESVPVARASGSNDPRMRSPLGEMLKFQARSPRPSRGLLRTTAQENCSLPQERNLQLRNIISLHVDARSGKQIFLVEFHGAPKPEFILLSDAQKHWPSQTDAFLLKVVKAKIVQRYKNSAVVARLTGAPNRAELIRSNSF